MDGGTGMEQIPGVDKDDVFPLTPQLFDEGGSPGQTAKQEFASAAGLDLSMNVGRKNEGDGFPRV